MAMRGGCRFSEHSLSASAEWRREEARSFRGGGEVLSLSSWRGLGGRRSVSAQSATHGKGGEGGRGKGEGGGGRRTEDGAGRMSTIFLFLFFYFILFLFSPSPPFCFPRIWISLFSRSTRGDTQRATSRGRQAFPGSVAYGVGRRPSHSSLASVWTLILAASNGCSCRFHTTCAAPHATQRNGRTTRADIHPNAVPGGAGRGGESAAGAHARRKSRRADSRRRIEWVHIIHRASAAAESLAAASTCPRRTHRPALAGRSPVVAAVRTAPTAGAMRRGDPETLVRLCAARCCRWHLRCCCPCGAS